MRAYRLGGATLMPEDVADLAPRIRLSDRLDCALHDCDAGMALADGLRKGPAWGVTWGSQKELIGAIGWTFDGHIWSLWADLTPEQSKAIMSRTPSVVKALASQAQRTLGNSVRDDNHLTIAWLRASKCFNFTGLKVIHQGHTYLPFFVKPLGDL